MSSDIKGGKVTKNTFVISLTILLSAICLTSIAAAQTSWWKTYGGTSDDEARSVRQTADGGYIIAGLTCSIGPGAPDSANFYLIKTDSFGDTLWTRVYGGTRPDVGTSVEPTNDGGYIVAGYTSTSNGKGMDIYVIKTDSLGDMVWATTYGGPNGDCAYSIQQTADAGYIVAGFTFSYGVMGDVYLIKIDSLKDTLWTRTYGGPNVEIGSFAQQTADSGYIIVGEAYSFGVGGADVYLVKTDPSGDTAWTRTYGGALDDVGSSVQQTAEGGYIIAGTTKSFGDDSGDIYLVKTNAQGDTVWTRTCGGQGQDLATSVRQTPDGGYIVAGLTESFGAGGHDVYVIKVSAQGDTLWTRTYGGTHDELGYSVQQASDGGFIIAGYTSSFGAGNEDVYFIKTDSLGNVGVQEPLTRRPASPIRLTVQPNPFTACARVKGHETELFTLSDVTGRQVSICKGDRIGAGFRPGVYFLSPVGSRAAKSATATIVKTAS
jgi:hypothetical protein